RSPKTSSSNSGSKPTKSPVGSKLPQPRISASGRGSKLSSSNSSSSSTSKSDSVPNSCNSSANKQRLAQPPKIRGILKRSVDVSGSDDSSSSDSCSDSSTTSDSNSDSSAEDSTGSEEDDEPKRPRKKVRWIDDVAKENKSKSELAHWDRPVCFDSYPRQVRPWVRWR